VRKSLSEIITPPAISRRNVFTARGDHVNCACLIAILEQPAAGQFAQAYEHRNQQPGGELLAHHLSTFGPETQDHLLALGRHIRLEQGGGAARAVQAGVVLAPRADGAAGDQLDHRRQHRLPRGRTGCEVLRDAATDARQDFDEALKAFDKSEKAGYTASQVLATIYRALDIDPAQTVPDNTGRPRHILDDREVVRELV